MLPPLLHVLPLHTVHDFNKQAGQGFVDLLKMMLDPYIERPVYASLYSL